MSGYRPDNGFSGLMTKVRQELKEAATSKLAHPQNVTTNEEPQIDAEELGVEEYEDEDLNKVPPQKAPVSKSKKDPRYAVRLVKDTEIENPAKTKLESKGDLYLCNNCFKTFRNTEGVCTECRSNIVERVVNEEPIDSEDDYALPNKYHPKKFAKDRTNRKAQSPAEQQRVKDTKAMFAAQNESTPERMYLQKDFQRDMEKYGWKTREEGIHQYARMNNVDPEELRHLLGERVEEDSDDYVDQIVERVVQETSPTLKKHLRKAYLKSAELDDDHEKAVDAAMRASDGRMSRKEVEDVVDPLSMPGGYAKGKHGQYLPRQKNTRLKKIPPEESVDEHEKGMTNDYYVDQIVDVVKNIVKSQGNSEISLENLQTTILYQMMDAVVAKLEGEGISVQ